MGLVVINLGVYIYSERERAVAFCLANFLWQVKTIGRWAVSKQPVFQFGFWNYHGKCSFMEGGVHDGAHNLV